VLHPNVALVFTIHPNVALVFTIHSNVALVFTIHSNCIFSESFYFKVTRIISNTLLLLLF